MTSQLRMGSLPMAPALLSRADVGIVGDSIRSIGDLESSSTGKVIDVSDLFIAPDFIDIYREDNKNSGQENEISE